MKAESIISAIKPGGTLVRKINPVKRIHGIATNQVSSYYNLLNSLRQQEAGITSYYWGTMLDSRVRPAHRTREGKVYSWNKPPIGGHPGEDIGCRCIAYPNLNSFL